MEGMTNIPGILGRSEGDNGNGRQESEEVSERGQWKRFNGMQLSETCSNTLK